MQNNFELTTSHPIPWETAKALIKKYNRHSQKWMTGGSTLSAFRISVDKLMEVATADTNQEEVKDVLIVFGYNDGSITTPENPTPQIGFTAIVIGVDVHNNMILDGNENIQDFLDTCPHKCPNKVETLHLHEW